LAYDPGFYREIGRAGGRASVAARRAQVAEELEPAYASPKSDSRTHSLAGAQPAIATLDAILEELDAPLKRAKQARNG
jgi:hypothetical protein